MYFREARESESFEKLATNSTSTNHENFCILKKTQNDIRNMQNDESEEEEEEKKRVKITLIMEEAIEIEG